MTAGLPAEDSTRRTVLTYFTYFSNVTYFLFERLHGRIGRLSVISEKEMRGASELVRWGRLTQLFTSIRGLVAPYMPPLVAMLLVAQASPFTQTPAHSVADVSSWDRGAHGPPDQSSRQLGSGLASRRELRFSVIFSPPPPLIPPPTSPP